MDAAHGVHRAHESQGELCRARLGLHLPVGVGRVRGDGITNAREEVQECCRGDEIKGRAQKTKGGEKGAECVAGGTTKKGGTKTVCPLRALPLCGFFTRSNPASAEDIPADHTVAYVLLLILFLRCFVYND